MLASTDTPTPRSGRALRFAARLVNHSLVLVSALLIASAVACSKGGGGGGDDSPIAAASATGGSGSGGSSGTAPGAGTGGGAGDPGSGSGNPQGNAGPRTYSVRFLPSPSSGIQGYMLQMGASSGNYTETVDIPLSSTNLSAQGVLWYELTLDSDRDYFMTLRAYDDMALSPASNEIRVAAVDGTASSGAGQGSNGSAIFSSAAASGSAVAAPAETSAASERADERRERATATDSSAEDEAEQTEERDVYASLDFDGAGEHLASSAAAELGSAELFSLSMWARPIVDDAPRRVLMDVRGGGDANRMILAVVNSTDLELTMHDVAGAVLHRARFAEALIDGVWQHLAVVFDAQTDTEPHFFVDAEALIPAESVSAAGSWPLVDSVRRIFLGAEAGDGAAATFRGQLGHAGIWADALSQDALREISMRGHEIDLREPADAYRSQNDLLHYWRLGDDSNGVGFDFGPAGEPIDLDDPAGGIDERDIVADGPDALELAAQ